MTRFCYVDLQWYMLLWLLQAHSRPTPPSAGACTFSNAGSYWVYACAAYTRTGQLLLGVSPHKPHRDVTIENMYQGKADGIFVENGHHVSFTNVTISYEGDRSAHTWFGKCINVDDYSTGVVGAGAVKCINGET